MQRKTHTALAALMALGIAGGASAQSLGGNADASVGAGAGDNGSVAADVGAGAGVAKSDTGDAGTAAGSKEMGSDMSVASDATSDADGVKTYGQLVSSMKTMNTASADLSGFDADSDVTVTTLSSLEGEGAENGQALDNAISENQAQIDEMRSNISANTDLMAALEAEGYEADQVIAVQTDGEAGVTFFVDDTM